MDRQTERGVLGGGLVAALLVGGAVAAALALLLDEPTEIQAAAGGGSALLTLLVYLAGARRARTALPAGSGRFVDAAQRVEVVAPAETTLWLRRASAASKRLDGHRDVGLRGRDGAGTAVGSPALVAVLEDASVQAELAAEQLADRAIAVSIIDTAIGDTDTRDLRSEQARLEREAEMAPPGALRDAKAASARAVADRVTSVLRLEELRRELMAALESVTLRLEAVAEHGGMLLSVQVAGDAAAQSMDLSRLTGELRSVQEGLDQLEELTRALAADG
ncbi:hypothetical protein [Streptomyces otsuchiensis]|uniref:hypothetical protein n=1 Tax=Streptomyces otsuchiensis TaxID=2681388 RepID=UPI00102F4F3C|nr:hypothetical protein [Streptomyces otsuchiensis]